MPATESLMPLHRRRRPRSNAAASKQPNITQLWDHHHEMLNRIAQGEKATDIARDMGYAPATVTNVVNSPIGREKLQLLRGVREAGALDVQEEIKRMMPQALSIYEKIIYADEESGVPLELQLKAADRIVMDIGGHRAPTRTENKNLSARLTMDDIIELKQRRDRVLSTAPDGTQEE